MKLSYAIVIACSISLGMTVRLEAEVTLPTLKQVQTLDPGATSYELLFVTADFTTAISSDVATYNAFVTAEADEDPVLSKLAGVSWHAIVSTPTTNANLNAPFTRGVPIFNTNANPIADDQYPLYVHGCPLGPIIPNQFGGQMYGGQYVWTGSAYNGTPSANPMGAKTVTEGTCGMYNDWIAGYNNPPHAAFQNYPIVALSSPIAIPEPSTFALFSIGAISLAAYAWRRRKRTA